ncbi:MAG: phosphodiester glycosidase family protein [Verrucomicrobiota bacterium]
MRGAPLTAITLITGLILGFITTETAQAQWRVISSDSTEAQPVYHKVVVSDAKSRVALYLCEFSTSDYALRIVDQGKDQANRRFTNLSDAMHRTGCSAGLNGGFYGEDFKALGLVVQHGETITPYYNSNRSGLTSGVLWYGKGGIHIVRRQSFQMNSGVKQAIQTGPMLVWGGSGVAGLSTDRPRPRSFVFTDWKGTWMLGTSSSVTLADLSSILDSSRELTGIHVDRAINLDGGRSTGMFVQQDTGTVIYRSEISKVRNFIGILKK